jgi:hypothetical protein
VHLRGIENIFDPSAQPLRRDLFGLPNGVSTDSAASTSIALRRRGLRLALYESRASIQKIDVILDRLVIGLALKSFVEFFPGRGQFAAQHIRNNPGY